MGQTVSTTKTKPATSLPLDGQHEEDVTRQQQLQERVLVSGGSDDSLDEDEDDVLYDEDYTSDDCEIESDDDDAEDGYDTDDESNDEVDGESEDAGRTDDGRTTGTSIDQNDSSRMSSSPPGDFSQMALVLADLEDHTLSELILTAPLSERNIREATMKIKQLDQKERQGSETGDDKSSSSSPATGKGKGDRAHSTARPSGVAPHSSGSLSSSSSVTESTLYYSASRAQYLKNHHPSSSSYLFKKNKSTPPSATTAHARRVCGGGHGGSPNLQSTSSVGHTTDNDDDRTVGLCFRILRLSPTMAKMRFKLVPTKCPEHIFWLALWSIMYETYQQEHDGQHQPNNSSRGNKKKNELQEDENASTFSPPRLDDGDVICSSGSSPDQTIFKLRRENERLGWTIDDLRKEIDDLKKQIQEQNQQQEKWLSSSSSPARRMVSSSTAAATTTLGHSGTWMIDDDSKDFLSYPPELKANLRQEKMKRLQEVRQQMQFILDTDNVEDTNGRWSCCGQTSYHDECSCMHTGGK